jgi:hypothetical protein
LDRKIKEEKDIDAEKKCRLLPIPTIEKSHNRFSFPAFRQWKKAFLAVRRDLSKEAIVNGLKRVGYDIEMSGSLEIDLGQETETTKAFKEYLQQASMLYLANAYGEPQVQLFYANLTQELERRKVAISWELYVYFSCDSIKVIDII